MKIRRAFALALAMLLLAPLAGSAQVLLAVADTASAPFSGAEEARCAAIDAEGGTCVCGEPMSVEINGGSTWAGPRDLAQSTTKECWDGTIDGGGSDEASGSYISIATSGLPGDWGGITHVQRKAGLAGGWFYWQNPAPGKKRPFEATDQTAVYRIVFIVDDLFSGGGDGSIEDETSIPSANQCPWLSDFETDVTTSDWARFSDTQIRAVGFEVCDQFWDKGSGPGRHIRIDSPTFGIDTGRIQDCVDSTGDTLLTLSDINPPGEAYDFVGRQCVSCRRNKIAEAHWDTSNDLYQWSEPSAGTTGCAVGDYVTAAGGLFNPILNASTAAYNHSPVVDFNDCDDGPCTIEIRFESATGLDSPTSLTISSRITDEDGVVHTGTSSAQGPYDQAFFSNWGWDNFHSSQGGLLPDAVGKRYWAFHLEAVWPDVDNHWIGVPCELEESC